MRVFPQPHPATAPDLAAAAPFVRDGAEGPSGGAVLRLRPLGLPPPVILQDVSAFDGYHAASFWPREDAFLLHPPRRDAICAVCRGVPIGGVIQVAASVQYICPVQGAREAMEKVDPTLVDNQFIFPSDESLAKVKVFRDLTPAEETSFNEEFQKALGA